MSNEDDAAMVTSSYQRVAFRDEINLDADADVDVNVDSESDDGPSSSLRRPKHPLRNFLIMSVLFSANHGCVVSCMALASARLGSVGAWQSGLLMFSYAASSLLGATYAVKTLGARNSLTMGMFCYCAYVGCFWVAAHMDNSSSSSNNNNNNNADFDLKAIAAYLGALIGGVGAGFLWTAQGTYFGLASQDHASRFNVQVEESTAKFAGYFAFLYLMEELLLRLLSSTLLGLEVASWEAIFGIYTLITVASTAAMPCWVHDYPTTDNSNTNDNSNNNNGNGKDGAFYKVTVAFYLLKNDPKMKYMIGLNAVFGFVAAFLNSYVNGQVVPVALDDPESKYIGVLNSMVSAVAAAASLLFGRLAASSTSRSNNSNSNSNSNSNANGNSNPDDHGVGIKGAILIFGALCFGGVVLPFCIQPDASAYGWPSLIVVYALHGMGRATFEGTLRSTFVDYFSYEKEGAFANIIFQNGIASGVGYILTFSLICEKPSRYCVEYSNGTLHDVLTFELIALVSVVVAIGGYLRASQLRRKELAENPHQNQHQQRRQMIQSEEQEQDLGGVALLLQTNEEGVST
uniref:Nodulin-like domain-containing protein n=1 Tax=Pseudo-nitzschia australis TaxID=44445 RepID=A0A7S4AER2_9STRA